MMHFGNEASVLADRRRGIRALCRKPSLRGRRSLDQNVFFSKERNPAARLTLLSAPVFLRPPPGKVSAPGSPGCGSSALSLAAVPTTLLAPKTQQQEVQAAAAT